MNLGFADKKLVEPNVGVFTVHLNIRQGLMLNILNIMKESFLPYAPAMPTTVYFCAIQHHDSAKWTPETLDHSTQYKENKLL